MKIRKEAFILGAVIVSISFYLIFKNSDRSLYELPVLETIPATEISKITLESSQKTILLTTKAEKWIINEEKYLGNESKIKSLVKVIAQLKLTTLISESKKYDRYGLDPETMIVIKAWNGDNLVREFEVGNSTSGLGHTFVKLPDDHRVYHVLNDFRSTMEGEVDDFREKRVLAYEADLINEVQIWNADQEGKFVKDIIENQSNTTQTDKTASPAKEKQPRWRKTTGEAIQNIKLVKLVKDMSSLNCDGFIYDRKKIDFSNPIAKIILKGSEEFTLQIFEQRQKDASDYPAVSSHNDYPFVISKWRADQVINALSDILPPESEGVKKEIGGQKTP
jgi:hypothetical protein